MFAYFLIDSFSVLLSANKFCGLCTFRRSVRERNKATEVMLKLCKKNKMDREWEFLQKHDNDSESVGEHH